MTHAPTIRWYAYGDNAHQGVRVLAPTRGEAAVKAAALLGCPVEYVIVWYLVTVR